MNNSRHCARPYITIDLLGEINDQLTTQTHVSGTCDLCLKGQVQGTASNREYYGLSIFAHSPMPPNTCVETLVTSEMLFGGGACGGELGLESGALVMGLMFSQEETQESLLPLPRLPCEEPGRGALTRTQPC